MASQNSTNSTERPQLHFNANCLQDNSSAWTTQETQTLFCWEGVYTEPFHSNGSYSIVACVFVAAGMCLPSRCLAINIYSDFTMPAFEGHVTISNLGFPSASKRILQWSSSCSPPNNRDICFFQSQLDPIF
jgi:hypothetical protein